MDSKSVIKKMLGFLESTIDCWGRFVASKKSFQSLFGTNLLLFWALFKFLCGMLICVMNVICNDIIT